MDRSIESLKFSLHGVAQAEEASSAMHIAPLVEVQFVDELSSTAPSSEELVNLGYSSKVLESANPERKVKDASAVMEDVVRRRQSGRMTILQFFDKINDYIKNIIRKIPFLPQEKVFNAPSIDAAVLRKINEYENRGEFDEAINLYRDAIKSFLNYAQTPALILRLGYLLHRLGRFKEAEELYAEIERRFPNTPESMVTKELIDILKKRSFAKKETDEIASIIAKTSDKNMLQQLYYKQGLIGLSSLNLEQAKGDFSRAVSLAPGTEIADMASLRIGVCERLLGQLDASLESFKRLTDMTTNTKLKMWSEHQLAQIYHQKGDYENATAYLEKILQGYNDKSIVPLLLFQLGSTYLYDAKDPAKAKKVFEELRVRFPGKLLVYPGTSFVDEELKLDVLPDVPKEINSLMSKTWLEKVMPEQTLKQIEARALALTNSITEIAQNTLAKEKEKDKDKEAGESTEEDAIVLEITEDKANELVKGSEKEDSNITASVDYIGEQQMITYGDIRLPGGKIIKGYLRGSFKIVSMVDDPYWVEEKKRKNYLIFTVDECRIGNIVVPPDIMNAVLRSSLENFNQNFPLDIQKFDVTKETLVLAGPEKKEGLEKPVSSTEYEGEIKKEVFKELEKRGLSRKEQGLSSNTAGSIQRSERYGRQKQELGY